MDGSPRYKPVMCSLNVPSQRGQRGSCEPSENERPPWTRDRVLTLRLYENCNVAVVQYSDDYGAVCAKLPGQVIRQFVTWLDEQGLLLYPTSCLASNEPSRAPEKRRPLANVSPSSPEGSETPL